MERLLPRHSRLSRDSLEQQAWTSLCGGRHLNNLCALNKARRHSSAASPADISTSDGESTMGAAVLLMDCVIL
jgi:hypothetical protein